jgi:putative ABC transport system permease protein
MRLILLRSLLKDKLNTFIIVISLATGLTFINQIILFVVRESTTDKFHNNIDRIYMLKCDDPFNKGSRMFTCRLGGAEYMKENFAQVEDYCRIKNTTVQQISVNGQLYFDRLIMFESTPNFFSFFTYPVLTKNSDSVLETNGDIVISENLANKYFGTSNPIGKIITLTVRGVKKDNLVKGVFKKPESGSQLSFDMVTFNNNTESFAFLLLKGNSHPDELEKVFAGNKEKIPNINDGTPGQYYLENFRKAYFDTARGSALGPVRNKTDLQIALVIGVIILMIASFNYLGLINNKLLSKTHEFYIRDLNGASKVNLIIGFMTEILILVIIAFILSIAFLYLVIPFFNEFAKSDIQFKYFFQNYNLLIMIAVIISLLLVTLLFTIAKLNFHIISPATRMWVSKRGKIIQIPIFNIIQLTVSIVLLICSIIIVKQIRYIEKKDIGLNKDVIEVKLPTQYSEKTRVFKEELLKNPGVNGVSITTASPLLENRMELMHYTFEGEDKQYTPSCFFGDENFISTLGIRLIDGNNFSGNAASDKNNCLINESLGRKFQNQILIGEKLPGDGNRTVIGVVKDFNFSTLKETIEPGIITFDNSGNHLLVKPIPGMLTSVHKSIVDAWQKLIPDYPVSFESVKDRYEWLHRENSNYLRFIASCCFISLFLSMIGLFAISYNSSRIRTKEIGLRKINGATIPEILFLLNKEFFRWILIAFIIASPIAWFLMDKWLQVYAYRTSLSFWVMLTAGLLLIVVSVITVSWQSWRAAKINPVETLRFE